MASKEIEEVLKKNDRIFQIDKGLRLWQDVHTGWTQFVGNVELGLQTVQQEPAFAVFRRLYTGPVTDAGLELQKAADAMIEELQTIHARPSLLDEELDAGKELAPTLPGPGLQKTG